MRNIACQGWSIDKFLYSYLIKGLIYFCFLNTFLISNYSDSERFLKRRRVCPQIHSLSHYKVDIFSFLTAVLIIYYSASERFLIIGLVGLVKFFSPYPLMGKFIFLKKYHSNVFIFIVIQRFLIIELVYGIFLSYPLRACYIFIF